MGRAVLPTSLSSEGTLPRDVIERPKPESRYNGKVAIERHEL